jgi:outer membrane protein, heavy metal efflux system
MPRRHRPGPRPDRAAASHVPESAGSRTGRLLRMALATAPFLIAPAARGQVPDFRPPTDEHLAAFVKEALDRLPEIRQGSALARAESERIPQAGALPDPTVTFAIVNDGFDAIRVGEMETSYYQAMYEQPLPWPGKRKLRTRVAARGADIASARLERLRLGAESDVRRAYIEIVAARDRLALLAAEADLWQQGEGLARIRYEVGAVPQSDLIRAQLERTRLRRQRIALEADEKVRVQELNRLLGHELAAPVDAPWHLSEIGLPRLFPLVDAFADAVARSPELLQARLEAERAGVTADLARRERFPDMAVGGGVMPRGELDPMWTMTFRIGVPLWAGRKQARFVAESELRREAEIQGREAIHELLLLRTAQRHELLGAALETAHLFSSGLLVQSEGATESTMAQYRVGRVPLSGVLEVVRAYVADRSAHLEALAQSHLLAVAQWELSLSTPQGAPAMRAPASDQGLLTATPSNGGGDGM